MPFVKLSVTTAPVYEKNHLYIISDIDKQSLEFSSKNIISDGTGRLKIELNGSLHEVGINKPGNDPMVCIASANVMNYPWIIPNKEIRISLKLLNKGLGNAVKVKAVLSSDKDNIRIIKNISSFGDIEAGKIIDCSGYFAFSVSPDTIEVVKLKLTISDKKNNAWIDYIELPVRRDPSFITEFEIADGKLFKVAQAGIDTVEMFLGSGNGDGMANPGESLVLLVMDQGLYRRTELFTVDPYVNQKGINIRNSDNWSEYDHVGGSAKYSIPLISSECPQNHKIEFLGTYWLPDYPDHIIKQVKFIVNVTGTDITPPVIRWADVSGDNTVHVKAFDGSDIKQIRVRFTDSEDPQRTFEAILNDDGKEGDRIEADRLFSRKIPDQKFGLFIMEIEAVDAFENLITEKYDGPFVFH